MRGDLKPAVAGVPGREMRSRNPFAAFGRHRNLTRELVRNEILGRYRGASFGVVWSLLGPFLMLVVYTIAFGSILKGRWPQVGETHAEFGLVLFVGFFAECLSRAPRLMVDNANYVKRVVFPLDILPWTVVLTALFHLAMNVLVFCLLSFFVYSQLSPMVVLLPVVLLPLVLVTVAVSWVVASLGVYLRDIAQVVPVVSTAMFFLSSAIVPLEAVPDAYQVVFRLNPLTFFIDQSREVALWGRQPDWQGLALYFVGGLVAACAAHAWFRRTSRGFADVL